MSFVTPMKLNLAETKLETTITPTSVVGIDIGGANIKAASALGKSVSRRFPLWIEPERLGENIAELLRQFARFDRLAVTMTGELADCFATRREGVRRILEQVAVAHPAAQTSVYTLDGKWYTPLEATSEPWNVASSNWHALATWVGQSLGTILTSGSCLLVDVGSTTVDVVPIENCRPSTPARTDRDRLQLGQLVYTGIQRTPVAAIVRNVMVAEQACSVCAERFATSDDAYLTLRLAPQDSDDCDTADGRPRTVPCAQARLARMVGEDSETLPVPAIEQIASQILDAQFVQVASAVQRNFSEYFGGTPGEVPIVATGHGKPLLDGVLSKIARPTRVIWLEDLLSAEAARCAPAVAVACLLEQELG